MNFKTVKKFTAEVGWGFLATSDGKKVESPLAGAGETSPPAFAAPYL